jgi:Zn-dependent protease
MVLLVPALLFGDTVGTAGTIAVRLALVASLINLLNLLPVMPFDGGHVVKGICQSIGPGTVRPALVFISVLMFAVAVVASSPLLLAPALVALMGMRQMSEPVAGLSPMAAAAGIGAVGAYAATMAGYSALLLSHYSG